jgi:hypothetical protein
MHGLAEFVGLVGQRTWDKELVLWVGSEAKLLPVLSGVHVDRLDLLDLFDGPPEQIDDDEVRQYLSRSLKKWLRATPRISDKRTVLIVRSAALLARYHVGVREFYDWFCDDFAMVILLVEGVCAGVEWPEEVQCDSQRILDYFSEAGMVKRQFAAV